MDTPATAPISTIDLTPAPARFADRSSERTARIKRSVQRLESIDLYRGILMVLMLIDHTRDLVHSDGLAGLHDPLDVNSTTWLLYLTRWITHLCAPGFVLLAGASAGFQRQRGTSVPALSKFLWTRGVALILIELVAVRMVTSFNVDLRFFGNLQVIWAIGVSMIALAALVHLPDRVILAIGMLIVCGHNALDGITVPVWKGAAHTPTLGDKLWILLHQGGFFPLYGTNGPVVRIHYPVLPWIGLMAVGFVFANLWRMETGRRRRLLRQLGVALIAAFIALRLTHLYGDNIAWHAQDTFAKTIGSFMNVQKYPPSLLFLLATLAPCLFGLSFLDGRRLTGPLARALITYGRVPMFYYLLQWAWAWLCGLVVTSAAGLPLTPYFAPRAGGFFGGPPPILGGTLAQVYLCWLLGVIVLYFPCRWYAGVKARRRDLVVLRYL